MATCVHSHHAFITKKEKKEPKMVPSFGEDIGNSHLCVMYCVIKIGKNLYVCLVYKNKTRTSNKCKKFFIFYVGLRFFVF